MRLALIVLAAPSIVAAAPPRDVNPTCKANHVASGGSVRPQKLGELPPAETWAAVYRSDEKGCPAPLRYRDRAGLKR